jgi:hypothetical protein
MFSRHDVCWAYTRVEVSSPETNIFWQCLFKTPRLKTNSEAVKKIKVGCEFVLTESVAVEFVFLQPTSKF